MIPFTRMTGTSRRKAGLAVLAAVALLAVTSPARAAVTPLRLMTYNTALMNITANLHVGVPPVPVPPGVSIPISIDTNSDDFGGQSYSKRVQLMADQIIAEDPDVVVLNEVWHLDQKNDFVTALAPNGYPNFISIIQGDPPGIQNPFSAPGLGSDIEMLADILGTPANLTPLAGVNLAILPFIQPLGPIYSVNLQYQDSGIMLFSKKPFASFDSPQFPKHPHVFVGGINNGQIWGSGPKEVAAVVYRGARGTDQDASKAVGFVRIQQTPTSIVDVAFSHTNADDDVPEANADVRADQMYEVRRMIMRALTKAELKSDQVYMLGDLNTPGNNKKYGTTGEWSHLFGPNGPDPAWKRDPGVFFACGDGPCSMTTPGYFHSKGTFMTDTWGYETSVEDRNKSNYVDHQYYDYVLHNRPSRQCMQHIRIGSEMLDDVGHQQLSDHLPIHVDFNLEAPHCSPNEQDPNGPLVVALDSQTPFQNIPGKITHPGSMQWYKINQPGTYWINITQNPGQVAFDVYADNDLSDPLHPYHGQKDPRKGERFVVKRPIYIRTYAIDANGKPDRTSIPDYSIRVQRAMGTGPTDSIGLSPASQYDYPWVDTGYDQPIVWFDFVTNQTINGDYADSTMVNETWDAGGPVGKFDVDSQLFVQTCANAMSPLCFTQIDLKPYNNGGNWADYTVNNIVEGYTVEMPPLPAKLVNNKTVPTTYYYVLHNVGMGVQPSATSHLTFLTDLTYLQSISIGSTHTVDQNPEDVNIAIQFDGTPAGSVCYVDFPCAPVSVTKSKTTDTELWHVLALQGAFKTTALPIIWAGNPVWDLGYDNGSQIYPASLPREQEGDVDCRWNNRKADGSPGACEAMYMGSTGQYAPEYDYHYVFGVTHDLP